MNMREGLIPTALGTAVTATGYALKQKRGSNKMIANTIFGFGLAHIVLGAIDLVDHRRLKKPGAHSARFSPYYCVYSLITKVDPKCN